METVKSTVVPCWAVTSPPSNHFFGYYDKSPWDPTGSYLLAHRASFDRRLPTIEDSCDLVLLDLRSSSFRKIGETTAWNWQQGSMLQWLPSSPDTVIYNERQKNWLQSVILNVESFEKKNLSLPVYTVSSDGRFGLSLNFEWLAFTRPGYGYASNSQPTIDPKNDGIYRLDLQTGRSTLLFSLEEIIHFQTHPIIHQSLHWLEHLLFNPQSSRFLFLHRFQTKIGETYTRLFTANTDGTELRCLISGYVSHYCWLDNEHIFVWARNLPFTSQVGLRQLLHRLPFSSLLFSWIRRQQGRMKRSILQDYFFLVHDKTKSLEAQKYPGLSQDGHPSLSPAGRWILLDTYPDKNSYRHLFLFDFLKKEKLPLASFYSSPSFSEGFRCDLHPRWNRNGTQVCIDSIHEGSRQIYLLDLTKLIHS